VMVAYILVQTDVGVIDDVAGEIASLKGVVVPRRLPDRTTSSLRPRRPASTNSGSW
jgi:hypothetical protein